jgi:hypothetical protein
MEGRKLPACCIVAHFMLANGQLYCLFKWIIILKWIIIFKCRQARPTLESCAAHRPTRRCHPVRTSSTDKADLYSLFGPARQRLPVDNTDWRARTDSLSEAWLAFAVLRQGPSWDGPGAVTFTVTDTASFQVRGRTCTCANRGRTCASSRTGSSHGTKSE